MAQGGDSYGARRSGSYSGSIRSSRIFRQERGVIVGRFLGSGVCRGICDLALSLILLALGTGVGLSSLSPWSSAGVSASTVTKGAIVWLILTQIVAAAMGGYLAGRLRTKWVSVHTHEVYFRDTAHGFLVWSVSLVITAAFLASAATSMVSGNAARNDVGATAAGEPRSDPYGYFVDSLFRSDRPAADLNADAALHAEVGLILARGLREGYVPSTDRAYLAQLVAARTGMDQAEAQRRVSDVLNQAGQAADDARRATAHFLYWTFLALLIGAFCASYAATIGGRQRDNVASYTPAAV
jgi:hypothetical protein